MNMSRYIVKRILAISVVILLAGLGLALWRGQFDVKRGERGAADEIRLFEYLYALENGPAADVAANLDALRNINSSRNLRHVHFALEDGDGTVLVAANAGEKPGPLLRWFALLAPGIRSAQIEPSGPWLLQRDDGRRFLATLVLNPASEQQEALDNLEGMLVVLLGYAAAILLAVWWTLKQVLAPMRPILDTIDRYERNDFSARLASLPFAETDAIGRALNHMADTLATAQEQRRALSLKLVSSQEDERLRIARELHDEFGQSLTALRADISWLTRRTAGQTSLQEVLQGMAGQCESLQQEIRELLSRLRPLDARAAGFALSLGKLMADLVQSWSERLGESTQFTLNYAVAAGDVTDDVALTIYRLTQEALTNCVRHAHATQVVVAVENIDGCLRWSVEDDGVGVDDVAGSVEVGNGLAGMRERAWALGSDLELGARHADSAQRGLRVAASFPARVQ
jgi:two-component system, NarL family, sensor histidine kinase UhpB